MESDNLAGQLLRAVRQAFFFGVEARLPYALVNIARPRSEPQSNPSPTPASPWNITFFPLNPVCAALPSNAARGRAPCKRHPYPGAVRGGVDLCVAAVGQSATRDDAQAGLGIALPRSESQRCRNCRFYPATPHVPA